VSTVVEQAAEMIGAMLPLRTSPAEIAAALAAAGLLWVDAEKEDVLDPVLRVLPEECWVTRTALARCTDLIGGVFSTGATWTEDMCCVPCRVRLAVCTIQEAATAEEDPDERDRADP
jgi:hypothetical protein